MAGLRVWVFTGVALWESGDLVNRKRKVSSQAGAVHNPAWSSTGTGFMEMAVESKAVGTVDHASKRGISICIFQVSTISPLFQWSCPCQDKHTVNLWFKDLQFLGVVLFVTLTFSWHNIFLNPAGLPCKYYTRAMANWSPSFAFVGSL